MEPVAEDIHTCARRLLVAASVVPSSQILVTLMNEALGFSETSVLTRATRRNIPEDTILQTSRCTFDHVFTFCWQSIMDCAAKKTVMNVVFWEVARCGSC
jgi:hypothetical protein